MFGVLKPTAGSWSCGLRNEWAGHFCGTCLALGDEFGQPARFATNYDAALISALTEAQTDEPAPRTSHVCPLRGFRRLAVVAPTASGAQYAASLSTLMVATKLDDHADDGDGLVGRLPTVFRALARRLRSASRRVARSLGFDTREIENAAAEQSGREAQPGRDFLFYSEPTERSAAAAFAHTAEIAERPENRGPLAEMGALFGRLMFLLDSFRDLDEDRHKGSFNALAAASEDGGEKALAGRLFQDAYARIRELLGQVRLARPRLVRQLLVAELGAVGERTLGVEAASLVGEEVGRKKKSGGDSGGCESGDGCCDCCPCDCCSCGSDGGSHGCCHCGCCDSHCGCCDSHCCCCGDGCCCGDCDCD